MKRNEWKVSGCFVCSSKNKIFPSVGNLIVAGKRVNMNKEQKGARRSLFSEGRREINESTKARGHADTEIAP